MKSFITILVLVAIGSYGYLNASFAYGDSCKYSKEIDRVVDLKSAKILNIEAGAGELEINGEAGKNDVHIQAKVCASEEGMLEQMGVISEVDGTSASFITDFPSRSMWNSNNHSASIDLVLTVPSAVVLDVEDSSGEASVEGVAALSMKDSSGRLTISGIAGDLGVIDSSGELIISDVGGSVQITDSSGAIEVKDVEGSLLVVADSSGAIAAKNIGKNVTVERDSSGAILVKNIGGDFVVLKDSSGGIEYKNVAGKVTVPN